MPLLHRNIKKYIQILKHLCIIWPILSVLYTRSEILCWRKPQQVCGVWLQQHQSRDVTPALPRKCPCWAPAHPSPGDGLSHRQGLPPGLSLCGSLHLRSSWVVTFAFCPLWLISVHAVLKLHIPTMKCYVCKLSFRHGSEIGFIFITATSSRLHKCLHGLFLSEDSLLSVLESNSVYHPLWRGSTNSGSFVSTLTISQGVLTFS